MQGERPETRGLRAPPVQGIERHGHTAVIRLAGELDLHNAEAVRAALRSALDDGATRIVADLSRVAFIDSTALGVLLEARLRRGEGSVVVAAPRAEIRRTLAVSGLDRHLPVRDAVEDALDA